MSLITLFVFPLTWIAFASGMAVETGYYVAIIANVFYHLARLFLTQENVGLSVKRFVREVYCPVFLTTILSIIPSILVLYFISPSYVRFFISLIVGVGMSACMALLVGVTKYERTVILNKAFSIIDRFKKR